LAAKYWPQHDGFVAVLVQLMMMAVTHNDTRSCVRHWLPWVEKPRRSRLVREQPAWGKLLRPVAKAYFKASLNLPWPVMLMIAKLWLKFKYYDKR
jgi:hypothetical protein